MFNTNRNPQDYDLTLVKGVILWNLNPGEIARRIKPDEFDVLSGAKGVYVQEGVKAVLMIDGRPIMTISSGVYYFDTAVERLGGVFRHIWRFFTGRKHGGFDVEDKIRCDRLGSELQNLGKNPQVEVILVAEGIIPVVFGQPFIIQAKREDLRIALSLQMEIDDFVSFRKNHITTRKFYGIEDLKNAIAGPIYNYLSESLAYETIDSTVLSPNLKERLCKGLIEKIESVVYGMRVRQIVDIASSSEDFNRLRELERKLYYSNKELEYLIRTNDFKNRLALEENSQKIRQARNEEDLRYELQKLNKDSLLHDDQMEEFCQLLANQKAIREAKTDEEREKALQNIQNSKLIREDEFEDLQYSLKHKHDSRVEEDLIFHWQSFRRTERERIISERDTAILNAESNQAVEQAEFNAAKQKLGHEQELGLSQAGYTVEINDIGRKEQEKDVVSKMNIRDAVNKQNIKETKDQIDIDDYGKQKHIEQVNKIREGALAARARLNEEKRKDRAQEYEENEKVRAHEEKMEGIAHETHRILIEAQKNMSATQIAALGLEKMTPEAQIALAGTLSSVNENEILKKTTDERVSMMKELIEQSRNIDKESREQQERTLNKMMDFLGDVLKTNASVVNGAVGGQNTSSEHTLNILKDIATHQQDRAERDKQEAKEDARYAQSRQDHAQDTALHYTTKFASTEATADAIKGGARQRVKCPICGNYGYAGLPCAQCSNPL